MFRKLICALIVSCLLLVLTVPAFAVTRYCSLCEKYTKNWSDFCSGSYAGSSPYSNHTLPSGSICNYYFRYYYTSQLCQTCLRNTYQLDTTHVETSHHDVCALQYPKCPY